MSKLRDFLCSSQSTYKIYSLIERSDEINSDDDQVMDYQKTTEDSILYYTISYFIIILPVIRSNRSRL